MKLLAFMKIVGLILGGICILYLFIGFLIYLYLIIFKKYPVFYSIRYIVFWLLVLTMEGEI